MKKGFALIYVLVITVIIMITITSILTLGSSDIRQKNKVLYTAGAYQMAQSGLEDGIANYRIGKPKDCSSHFYKVSAASNNYSVTMPSVDPINTDQGIYEFKICSGSPDYIEAVGYSKGSKLKMKADKGVDDNKWNIYQVGF